MAVADTAPASTAPSDWDAPDFSPDEGAQAASAAPVQGALAPKRKEAEKKGKEPESTLPVGQRPIDQPATAAPAPEGWDAEDFSPGEEPTPPAAAPERPGLLHIANIAAANFIDKFGQAGGELAGAFPVIADKVHSMFSGKDETGMQDAWFKHVVDPQAAAAATNELGEGATTAEKVTYGVSQTAAMIGSVFLTGPEMVVEEGQSALAARAIHGAASMTAPAATNAVDVGNKVLAATGDKKAAAVAATSSYLTNTAMGLVPAALGGKLVTKVATGAGIGAGASEVQRRISNASMPDEMHEDYDPLQTVEGAITGAAFGGYEAFAQRGGRGAAVEKHSDVIEMSQQHAADIVGEAGGDTLDQVVAATHATAAVGAEHDAHAVEAARAEVRNAQVEEDTQNTMAAHEGFQREQEFSAAERQRDQLEHAQEAPSADEAFAAREAEQPTAASKDRDFTAAKNQVGQEHTENALGEVRGGREEAPATLADAIPPEQLSALGALRDRLMAQKPAEEAPKTVVERMKEQAKGTDDDFQELPPETAPKQKAEEAPAAPQKAAVADEDEALPEGGPPPVTAQSLAERRAAAFDAAMAAKVGGKGPAVKEEAAPQPAQKSAIESAKPEQAPESAAEVSATEPAIKPAPAVNRLAAIRAAAEKARIERNAAPPREEMQWAARDPDSEANKQTFTSFDEAKAWKEAHPEDDIVQVPREAPKFASARRAEEPLQLHRDNPGGDWLEGKKQEAAAEGSRPVGAPKRFGTVTATFNRGVRVPMDKLANVRGLNDEQNNVRTRDLEGLKEVMANGRLPDTTSALRRDNNTTQPVSDTEASEYKPFVQVDQNGRAWMNEGNHRVMAGKALGWSHMPTEVRYFNGGENVPGSWHPDTLAAHDRALENTPRLGEKPKANSAEQTEAPDWWKEDYKRASADRLAGAADITRRLAASKAEVDKAVKPILNTLRDSVKSLVNIHHDDATLPPHLLQEATIQSAYGPGGELPRGVYDPSTKQIHILAQGHWTAEDAARTLVHELTHLGNRNVIKDYAGTMKSIFDHIHGRDTTLDSPKYGKTDKVTAREWIKDYAEQHGMDLGNEVHQVHVADEYVAHLADQHYAEPGHENAGLLQRFVQFMRSALHQMGLKFEWSDGDILDLARRNNTLLRDVRPDIAEREDAMSPQWASHQPDTDPALPPSDPEAMAAKFGRTMEAQAGAGPSALKSRQDFLARTGDKIKNIDAATMRARLSLLHLDSLPDIMRGMKTVRDYVKQVAQMEGRKGRLMDEGNAIALQWSRWAKGGIFRDPQSGKMTWRRGQADEGRGMADLMHASTIAGIHPDRPYEPRFTKDVTPDQEQVNKNGKALHARLASDYAKLDDEGRGIYQKVKQYYQDRRADVLRALEARIAETGATEATKKQAMTELRKKFEQGQVQGPYFPLARFGDYWARGVHKDTGQHVFARFEDVAARQRWRANAEAAGYETSQGTKNNDKSLMERIDPDFVKTVMAAVGEHPELQDEIWQHYLKAMPEMSMRKNLIHRQNILGYTQDALRGFAYNAFHSSQQIPRLEYGNRLDSIVNDSDKEAEAIGNAQPNSNNALWGPALAAELRARNAWLKNPKTSPLAASLTKLGFLWFIGGSPATAIRIRTQNAMIAEPYLAARASKLGAANKGSGVGYFSARGELWKASSQWAKAKVNSLGGSGLGDTLRGDERKGFDEARAQGTFMSTSSQNLAAGGAGRPIGTGKMDAMTRVASFMFNAMEHQNRESTYLAMYRLARRAGLSHEDATAEGIEASNKSHFNYNNYNRPRVLQNDAAKVIGLFKQYSWQVTDRLARSFRDGVLRNKELSPAEQNEQLKAFAGYMGKMIMFAGIKGVPILYHATMAAINAAYGDKDSPFDAQAAFREHMEEHIGKTASDAVMDGPMSAVTGAALSHGASYADLWYKTPDKDMTTAEQWTDALGQIGGPIPSIGTEAAKGIDIANRTGDIERGAEHFTPPAINHWLKFNRLRTEGAVNLRGEQVVSPQELGQGWSTDLVGMGLVRQKNLMLQALGLSPEVVARQYEKNTSAQNYKAEVTERGREIVERYDRAAGLGHNEEAIQWMGQWIAFHQAHPEMPFDSKQLVNSLRGEYKAAATADHGVNMNPGMAYEYNKMLGKTP